MSPSGPEMIQFPGGNQARAVYTPQGAAIDPLIAALQLPSPRAVLVVNGGTAQLDPDLAALLSLLIGDGLARVASEEQLTIVTGATDAGIFTLLGQGLERWGRTAPCIGVTVASLVQPSEPALPGQEQTPLEPHHSHFVLTEGKDWGDETATMYALIAALSAHAPSVMVTAGGGSITRKEVLTNTRQRRPAIVLAGSGRFADELSAVVRGEAVPTKEDVTEIARDGDISLFDLHQPPEQLAALVRQRLHLVEVM
jgi:SLOG in TRPM, prokaryote